LRVDLQDTIGGREEGRVDPSTTPIFFFFFLCFPTFPPSSLAVAMSQGYQPQRKQEAELILQTSIFALSTYSIQSVAGQLLVRSNVRPPISFATLLPWLDRVFFSIGFFLDACETCSYLECPESRLPDHCVVPDGRREYGFRPLLIIYERCGIFSASTRNERVIESPHSCEGWNFHTTDHAE
jgi:hypothetical protein